MTLPTVGARSDADHNYEAVADAVAEIVAGVDRLRDTPDDRVAPLRHLIENARLVGDVFGEDDYVEILDRLWMVLQ